jgi:uncharacterized protein YhaN
MHKKWISLIIIIVFFTGCATTSQMSDKDKTVSQGAGIGAAAGAALGALFGQLAGRDTKSTMLGAIIGGTIGAIAGGTYGEHVVYKKSQYASREDYLDACIASANQVNRQASQFNYALANEIRTLDRESRQILAKYQQQQVKTAALTNKKNQIDKKASEIQEQLQRALAEIALQKEVLAREKGKPTQQSAAHLATLDQKVKELEHTVSQLEGKAQALANISQSLSV